MVHADVIQETVCPYASSAGILSHSGPSLRPLKQPEVGAVDTIIQVYLQTLIHDVWYIDDSTGAGFNRVLYLRQEAFSGLVPKTGDHQVTSVQYRNF